MMISYKKFLLERWSCHTGDLSTCKEYPTRIPFLCNWGSFGVYQYLCPYCRLVLLGGNERYYKELSEGMPNLPISEVTQHFSGRLVRAFANS